MRSIVFERFAGPIQIPCVSTTNTVAHVMADISFAVGRHFNHNPGAGPGPAHGGEALRLGADALLDDLTPSARM